MASNEGKAEKLLKEFGGKIDELISKSKKATEEVREDIDGTAEDLSMSA